MAFVREDLKLLATTGDFGLWVYKNSAGDSLATMLSGTYFASASVNSGDGALTVGDIILAVGGTGTAQTFLRVKDDNGDVGSATASGGATDYVSFAG